MGYFAVAGDHLAGDDADYVVGAELGAGDLFDGAGLGELVGGGFGLGQTEGVGLGFAAAFGHGLGEVGEEDGEPEPEGDLEIEAEVAVVGEEIEDEESGGEDAADFDDEHDGVLHHGPGGEL